MKSIFNSIIKISLCAAILVSMFSVTSFADEDFKASISEEDNIEITGNAGASLKKCTVTVIAKDINEKIVYVDSCLADNDGSFSFIWRPSETGDYYITAKAGNVSFGLDEKLWYISAKEYERLMNIMKTGTATQINSVLSSVDSLKTLKLDENILKDYSVQNVSSALYAIREYTKDNDNVLEYIDDAKIVSKFVDLKTDDSFDALINMLTNIGIKFSNYDFCKGITNTEIKEEIYANFAKRIFDSFNELDSVLTENIILSGVHKCGTWVESDEYLSLLGYSKYDNSGYKSNAASAVAGKEYQSIDALKIALADVIDLAASNASGGGVTGGGGTGGGNGKTTVVGASSSVKPLVTPMPENSSADNQKIVFLDVPQSHWAFEFVNYLRWDGIVNGDDYNKFYPDKEITRAEMVAMLVRAFDVKDGECEFTDVPQETWYYKPIAAAFESGLVTGDGECFNPLNNLTRQDMTVMIYRFSKFAGSEYSDSKLDFADNAEISDYATEAVSYMTAAGIINGMDNGCFLPRAFATRAQAAKLIYSVIEK